MPPTRYNNENNFDNYVVWVEQYIKRRIMSLSLEVKVAK